MSKRKPTSSQHGIDRIDRYFCKSRRTESPVDKGEKTANDGDQQTLAVPTGSTAHVDEGNKTAETWSYKPSEQNWQILWSGIQPIQVTCYWNAQEVRVP